MTSASDLKASEQPALDADIDTAFQWKTIFTELASRHISVLDLFFSSTKAGPQFQRDLENLMEAYLNRTTPDEQESFKKVASERNKKVDEEDVYKLWNNLHHHNSLFKVAEAEIETESEQFWKRSECGARPTTVRGIAELLALDSSTPLDRLRPLIYRSYRKLFANKGLPSPYDTLCCTGSCIDLLTNNCGSCISTIPLCCSGNLCQPIPPLSGNSTSE
jgi:hypothetical protein